MTLSPDPVLQWCIEEALAARLEHEHRQAEQRQAAHTHAHQQAQAMLAQAAG